jgi:hypothetical protein
MTAPKIDFIDLKAQRRHIGQAMDDAILAAVYEGSYILGPQVKEFEGKLAAFCGAKHAIGCANGTDAIALPLMAMKLRPGDAVICPSFTFAATAEVVAWLGLMGLIILWRAWKGTRPKVLSWKRPAPLGFIGGFFDAIGGGGWGPVVTSTLLGSGAEPRQAIGTTNAAEFFVASAISATFVTAILTGHWDATGLADHAWSVGGLIAGGVLAAPFAGWMTKVLPVRALTWLVGLLVTGLAIWQAVVLAGLKA